MTALFADLVGSTPLAEQLDPEDVRLIVGEAVARMIRRVEAFGGTVKDLAGDGVLALFGAPAAHEDDPERAIRAGLAIAEDVAEYGAEVARGWAVDPLAVRVGVATGPVVVGAVGAGNRVEYGATGDAVNIAARLQTAAEPGTVLVGGATRRLVEALFEWDEPQVLELKGKSAPVHAAVARSARDAGTRVRGLEGVQARLVGRDRELAVARDALEAVLAGAGGILFLTGEPGIGKSRLLGEIHDLAASLPSERPVTWLEGRCVSYGESIPYWPFRDLVRRWLGLSADDPEVRTRVALRRGVERVFGAPADEAPYLGAMLDLTLEPDPAARMAELSPEALRYRTFEVVRTLLERLAADGPVVVALEDLHWADPTSIQLVERLLSLSEEAAVLLLVAQRPERDHPSWAVKEAAARALPHRTREIALEALTGRADRELLHALVGPGVLPADVEDRVLTHAEGNPFFLEEMVRSLADAGALARDGERWRFDHEVDVDIPPTVEKVILARIDRLTPECHRVLTAASVLGRQFGLPLLEGVVAAGGKSDESVGPALTDLQRLDLVAGPPSGSRQRAGERSRRPACWPITGWRRRTRTRPCCTSRSPPTGPGRTTPSTRPSPSTGSCCRSWSVAASSRGWRWCCSSWRSPSTCRCDSPRPTRRTGGRSTCGLRRPRLPLSRPRRSGWPPASCRTTTTRSRPSRGRTSSCACSCSTGWWRRGRSGP